VAQAVLADPAGISESSITAVARKCQTSETTVLRFCRALGLAGYPQLRIALARAAQFEEADHRAGAPVTSDIAATDTLADVVAKITYAAARAVTDTAAALDVEVLQAAIDAFTMAQRVDIYGVGASALVGEHLHQKLHRIGLVSFVVGGASGGSLSRTL
jgi:DNA-binding MurR/RpiR family transcriptional regulator